MGGGSVEDDMRGSNGQMGLCQRGQGSLKSSSDVLKALETIPDKFLVLRNEVLSRQGDLGIISRQCSRLDQ